MRYLTIALLLFSAAPLTHAELPDAPSPMPEVVGRVQAAPVTIKRHFYIDWSLYAGVAAVNLLDWTSTEQCQRMPWKCHEMQLPVALVRSRVGFGMYKAGVTAGTIYGEHLLEAHHHTKLAHLAVLAEIASTGVTDVRNYQIERRKVK